VVVQAWDLNSAGTWCLVISVIQVNLRIRDRTFAAPPYHSFSAANCKHHQTHEGFCERGF
jgi:hypothetical protein